MFKQEHHVCKFTYMWCIRRTFNMECKWRQQAPNMNNNTGSNLCSQYLPLQNPQHPLDWYLDWYIYTHIDGESFDSNHPIGFLKRSHDDIVILTWLWLILMPFTYKQYTYIYIDIRIYIYTYFKQKLPTGILWIPIGPFQKKKHCGSGVSTHQEGGWS